MQASNASNLGKDTPNPDVASLGPDETSSAPNETSLAPYEASPGPEETSLNLDMRMDLEPKSWAENEEGESSDQDEILEGIDYTKDF